MSKRDIGLRSRIIKHLCLVSSTLLLGSCLPRIDRFHPSRAPTGTVVTMRVQISALLPLRIRLRSTGCRCGAAIYSIHLHEWLRRGYPLRQPRDRSRLGPHAAYISAQNHLRCWTSCRWTVMRTGLTMKPNVECWTDSVPIIYSLKTQLMAS